MLQKKFRNDKIKNMESKFGEALVVADNSKKENQMSRIVIENFGDWRNFRKILKDARENVDYDPLENEFIKRKFINEILQSYADKISADDFKKLSYLITKEIKKPERREEKSELKSEEKNESAKEKYVQKNIPFGDKEREIIRKVN